MSEITKNTQKKKKKIITNLIKWAVLLGLMAFGYFQYQDFFNDALREVKVTPLKVLAACFLLANLYFVAEGTIISKMTATGDSKLTVWQGICCTYMCAFYRLATLGSGNGIAQVYYYSTKGIPASVGTGMSIAQYTFQKITIGVFGVISYFVLVAFGSDNLLKYSKYMALGAGLITLVCVFLFVITVSKTISNLVIGIGKKIIKEKSRLYPKLLQGEHAIENLQNQGRIIWRNKKLFLQVVFLNVFKFACWYIIPGVLFYTQFDVNPFFCMALMAVCNMVGCVMIAPSGVGTLDFVFAIFFGTVIAKSKAVAAALVIYRLFTWIIPFAIGLIPALFLKKTQSSE